MKRYFITLSVASIFMVFLAGCEKSNSNDMSKAETRHIAFLHHSTGNTIWRGGNNFVTKVKGKLGLETSVQKWFSKYNKKNNTNYIIEEQAFPKREPYGWNNYPFDYYNIWVKNGDADYYMEEPTLKTLSSRYDLIIFKHCFPASKIVFDGTPDIDSDRKMVENYKLQYNALREEMHKYPDTQFLVWTPPALTQAVTNAEAAGAATAFSHWVINDWDRPGDNIFIWDFRTLETGGGDYLLPQNAVSDRDSHPSHKLASKAYPLFCNRITDVIEGRGDTSSVTGEN